MIELANNLLVAVSLMLVLEGILPFLYPQLWRRLVAQLAQVSDANMRMLGLLGIMLGLALLWLVR